ncbi:MAG: 50S ribosomal protein L29 [Desulfurococcales archaeon ex4484_42]|nr:MAG: 50S ribosomal protein L29 [Desulfurococcales archaeon ex4484_42]
MSLSADEIRKMSPEERLKLLRELRLELIKLKTQAYLGTLTNTGRIRVVKRNIARILTVMREEELKKARKKRGKK